VRAVKLDSPCTYEYNSNMSNYDLQKDALELLFKINFISECVFTLLRLS
jgi:hypothetical protein